jgi:hypothetical protein
LAFPAVSVEPVEIASAAVMVRVNEADVADALALSVIFTLKT